MNPVAQWCASCHLQLNPNKTEVVWFGWSALRKLNKWRLYVTCWSRHCPADPSCRRLVYCLTKQHISKTPTVCSTISFTYFTFDVTMWLAQSIVVSRLDCCNSHLQLFLTLLCVHSSMYRMQQCISWRCVTTSCVPSLIQLHWCISYSMDDDLATLQTFILKCLSMVLTRRSDPQTLGHHWLHISASMDKFLRESFVSCSVICNETEMRTFKNKLKTFLFLQAFNCC